MYDLVQRAYAVYVPRIGLRPAPMDADYHELLRDGRVWVADEGGELAGLIVLEEEPEYLLVENVAVEPERQGAGVGRALLAFAEDRARARRLTEVRLYTHVKMTENQALYARLGYREIGRQVEASFERVYLAKRLDGAP
jgi:ribosomal protein S18 acetylase RimI-like enzyme